VRQRFLPDDEAGAGSIAGEVEERRILIDGMNSTTPRATPPSSRANVDSTELAANGWLAQSALAY
jgi:hypothetical protein